MNEEKFGKFIKEIRHKYNLTQKDLADKYNVSYQAISKWENGKNLPDISIMKQIAKDYNLSLDELLSGNKTKSKKKKYILILSLIVILVLSIIIILHIKGNFKFKTITTTCDDFTLSGNISYSNSKSAIFINNIEYCGDNNNEKYKSIECILYEQKENIENKISKYEYNDDITLEDFLEKVTFTIDDYTRLCKTYDENSLYIIINAKDNHNKITSYKIPLVLEDSCKD